MSNRKYQTIGAGRTGNGQIDLASGELCFVHEDTRSDSNVLPISVSHIYLSGENGGDGRYGKGFRLNLQQRLVRTADDGTRYDYYDANNTAHTFEERYYYKADGENRYHIAGDPAVRLGPADITEEYDGRLFYTENPDAPTDEQIRHEVFVKLISKDGLVLQKGTRDFKGSEKIDRRHEEVIKTEEEIEALRKNIQDLGFAIDEYSKFDSVYTHGDTTFTYSDMAARQRELEEYGSRLERYVWELQSSTRSITVADSLVDGVQRESQQGLLDLKRSMQTAKTAFEAVERTYLEEQDDLEQYGLALEGYINELQQSKAPYIEENNGKKNQTQMLALKRRLLSETRTLYTKTREEQDRKWNDYTNGEKEVILKQREVDDHKMTAEEYGLDLEAYMIELQSSRQSISSADSLIDGVLQRESQETLLQLKNALQESRTNYEASKTALLESQGDVESYGLGLEAHMFEIQSSKPSITVADSFVDGVQRESQEQLLEYKRALQGLKNVYEIKEEERVKEQYRALRETSERMLEKYRLMLDQKEYVLARLNEEIPVNFVTGKDGLVLGFNREILDDEGVTTGGDLVAVFDAYQNQAAVIYEDGRIKGIADADGKETAFAYDGLGRLMSVTDFRDRRTLYEYDKEGRLAHIVYQNGEESRFGYEEGLMTEMVPPSGSGPVLEYVNGRVTRISDSRKELMRIEYAAQSTTAVIDAKTGTKVTYEFDEEGNCLFEYAMQDGVPKSMVTYDEEDEDRRCSFVLSKNKFDDNMIEQTGLNAFGNQTTGDRVMVNGTGASKAEWTVDVSKLDDHATDYLLYGFAFAASLPIRGRRRTAYCDCAESGDDIPEDRRFELRARVEYGSAGDFDEFAVSFDHERATRQLAAIPVTLRETEADDTMAVRPTAIVVTADYSNNQGIAAFDRPSLSVGEWTYSVFDAERNKIQEYTSEQISDKIEGAVKTGKYKIRGMKNFFYDDRNNLTGEEAVVIREEWTLGDVPQLTWQDRKTYATSYEYNKQNRPIRTTGPKGMISETTYDENGRAVRSVTYHRSNPVSKFYSENEVAENGQVTAETDETGENRTVFEYVEGTSIVKNVTAPNGQTVSFGHDPHTDEVLAISAVVDDTENCTVYQQSKDKTVLDCGNTRIEYLYDELGRETSILVDAREYFSFEYGEEENGNDIVIAEYANGEGYRTISDKFGKVLEVQYNDGSGLFKAVLQNFYDGEDRLTRSVDLLSKETANFSYDESGNVTKEICGDVEAVGRFNVDRNRQTSVFRINTLESDGSGGLNTVVTEQQYTDNYDDEGEFVSVTLPTGDVVRTDNDDLGRLREMTTPAAEIEYGYLKRDDRATGIVNKVVAKNSDGSVCRIRYFYDANGNIKEIRDCGKLVSRYRYDGLDRLIREDNVELNRTETYEYDGNGNILYRTTYPFSIRNVLTGGEICEYVYDGDRLINAGNETVIYDENALPGNPSAYCGRSMEWSHLRDLRRIDDVRFRYNAGGIRIAKERDNEHTRYYWSGENLLAEKRTITDSDSVWDMLVDEELPIYTESTFIQYLYGPSGAVGLTVKHDNDEEEVYHFRKNLQGDVTHIHSADGSLKARYVYDAWGNHKVLSADGSENEDSGFIGNVNPIRYRGYHFDKETGLYYLQTRYYDPRIGRFINADSIDYADPETINGLNLYAYCGSNPVMRYDPSGMFFRNILDFISNNIVSIVQIGAGAFLVATGIGAGLGAALIIGGALGLAGGALGQIASGAGSMANGLGAISTGLSLFSFGIPGAIAGAALIGIGAATMVFGVNEALAGITGTNYIQQWTGIDNGTYGKLYLGLNIASSIVTIAGRLGMRAVGTKTIGNYDHLPRHGRKPYERVTRGTSVTNFDGRGNSSWSRHNAIHGNRIGNPHWHSEIGSHGIERSWMGMTLEVILKSIFRR